MRADPYQVQMLMTTQGLTLEQAEAQLERERRAELKRKHAQQPWKCWRDPNHRVEPHPRFGWPQCTVCRAAPDYWERPDYLPEDLWLGVYVPAQDALGGYRFCAPRSGIVGLESEGFEPARITVYYEGWVNGAMQYEDRDTRGKWEAGVKHAASRMVVAYPTIAMAALPAESLRRVGRYNPVTHELVVEDDATVEEWLA